MDSSVRTQLDQHAIAAKAVNYRLIVGGTFELESDWVRAFSGLQPPVFNIFQPLTSSGLDDDVLADTSAFFDSQGVRYAIELIHDQFPNGPDYLDARHYQPLPPQLAMSRNNSVAPTDVQTRSDVTVELVTTVPALTAFCTIMHDVFDFTLAEMIKFFSVAHLKTQNRDIIQHYLAFVDETPVSTGTVIQTKGVASVWNVATLDAHRGQGIATTLVNQMLTDLRDSGNHLVMLYSTPHAFQLFNRFGFEIFTQRQWFLPPGIDYQE